MIAISARRTALLRGRQKLGKYRIERRLASGGFAAVYEATDTIEGIRVALKIPHQETVNPVMLELFRREVRLIARLDHPNILPLKDASFIDDRFVIVFPLGQRTLSDRLRSRISVEKALDFAEQLLEGVAYAHRHRIIHCDIKPENIILFPGDRLRLTDFGIAKIAQRTIRGSGTGTVGYMAPEQAMGRPSSGSDVFSVGVILYRMLTGFWPEWPFQWPFAGAVMLRRKTHPDLSELIRRSLEIDPRRRFVDADQMLRAFRPAMRRTLRLSEERRRRRQSTD
ncbi:MAG: serine/threonine-protein kinase [Planctomycetaceae bacterium]